MSDLESEIQKRGLIKISSERVESPYRRVAKFLYLVGEVQAAKVLQRLTREQIEKVVAEMLTIRHVDKDEAAYILSEFTSLYNEAKNSMGGIETAETILKKAFGVSKARSIIEKSVPAVPEKPLDFLSDIDGEILKRILTDELLSTQALILSQLAAKTAAAYIKELEPEIKTDIMLRLARLEKIQPEVLRAVSASIREKLKRIQASNTGEQVDGQAVLAAILRQSDAQTGEFILNSLAEQHPELEQNVRERLFTFEDIIYADDLFLQKKLAGMDDYDIAALVSCKSAEFVKKIFSNISKNRSSFISDIISETPPIPKICRSITTRFLSELRADFESGRLLVCGKDEVWID